MARRTTVHTNINGFKAEACKSTNVYLNTLEKNQNQIIMRQYSHLQYCKLVRKSDELVKQWMGG